jgi:hypothetical protein
MCLAFRDVDKAALDLGHSRLFQEGRRPVKRLSLSTRARRMAPLRLLNHRALLETDDLV